LNEWLSDKPFELEVVERPGGARGFVRLPRRWVVERTFAWLGRYRRHSRDYERRTESSESMIRISAIHGMVKRLKHDHVKKAIPFNYARKTET
jgi:putative transposase